MAMQLQLLTLLADGKFHAPSTLAKHLNIPLASVTTLLTAVSEYLELNVTGTDEPGYRLNSSVDLLSKEKIIQTLSAESLALISALEIHPCITSTNSYLVEAAVNNKPSGSICLAEAQTAGKGRLGRQWVSPFGRNIYLSVLWRYPATSPTVLSGLSLAIGVGVIRALTACFPKYDLDVGLKWPNDIVSQGKKLGGILLEVSTTANEGCSVVIGIGLNLCLQNTEADAIAQPWTDLKKLTGRENLPRNELTGSLLTQLLPIIADFPDTGISHFLEEWRGLDCLTGKEARLYHGKQQLSGVVQGIDDKGLLLMKMSCGKIQAFASGEVSLSGTPL